MRYTGCLLAVLLSGGMLRGLEPTGQQAVPAASLESRSLTVGAAVAIVGKYKELVGTEVRLYDCDLPFRIEHGDLTRKLRELQAQRDNVLIRGTVIAAGSRAAEDLGPAANDEASSARLAVRVDSLERTAGDVELFGRALQQPPRALTPADLESLLGRMTTSYRRFPDAALMPLFRTAFLKYVDLIGGDGKASAATAFAALREMHLVFEKKELTLELAQRLLKEAKEPAQLAQFLSSIGCRKYKGQWLTYEDLKRQEGFVEHENAWVQPREKHLADLLERLNSSRQPLFIIRKRTDREYLHLAQKGSVEEGMKLEEVSLAIGFPDRVERRMFEQKELTQWSYGNTVCYFYDGLLLRPPEKT